MVRLGRHERALAELERRLLSRGPVATGTHDEPALLVGRVHRWGRPEDAATVSASADRSCLAMTAHPASATV